MVRKGKQIQVRLRRVELANRLLEWLKESQKALKWSDETMLSFLAGEPYKVSGKSVTEALGKLTREQAVDFTNQINTKVEKQPKLI